MWLCIYWHGHVLVLSVFSGLLTVNPFERLSIDAVMNHPWLMNKPASAADQDASEAVDGKANAPSLQTAPRPTVLPVYRQGKTRQFQLKPVGSAPLVKRRRIKKGSISSDSSSTGSEGLLSGDGVQLPESSMLTSASLLAAPQPVTEPALKTAALNFITSAISSK